MLFPELEENYLMFQPRVILKSLGILALLAVMFILLIAVLPGTSELPTEAPQGVVVEEVAEGSVLAQVGIRPGDVLLTWERLPNPPANPTQASGNLDSIFDWLWVDWDERARGRFRFLVERRGEMKAIEVPMGFWGAQVRPRFSGTILESYSRGRDSLAKGAAEEGINAWKIAAGQAQLEGNPFSQCWLEWKIGTAQWLEAKDSESALLTFNSTRESIGADVSNLDPEGGWGSPHGDTFLR